MSTNDIPSRKSFIDFWPLIIFSLSLIVRLIYILELKDHPFHINPQLDSQQYAEWAWKIAHGDWLGGDKAFYTSPFYTYFLALVFAVCGRDFFIVRIIQVIFSSMTWVLTYWIGRDLFSRRVGVVAGILGSFYSYSIFLDGEIFKNSLVIFSTTLTIYLIMKVKRGGSVPICIFAALSYAVSVLSQPNLLLLLPLFAVWLIDWQRRSIKNTALVVTFIVSAMIFISPATIRNYIVEKDFVLISYNGGAAFQIGNNEEHDGGIKGSELYILAPSLEEKRTRQVAEDALGQKLKSSEISKYWFSLGLSFINENPLLFIKHTVKKFFLFWNWYEVPDNIDYYFFKKFSTILSLPLLTFGFLAPLAICGFFLALGEWRKHLLNYLIIVVFMLSLILFFIVGRYRATIIPILCIYAAYSIDILCKSCLKKDIKILASVVLMISFFSVIVNMNILKYNISNSQKVLGKLYFKDKMYENAIEELGASLKVEPFDHLTRLAYASSLENAGFKSKAMNEYKMLLNSALKQPTKVKVHLSVGNLSLKQGDRSMAKKSYADALGLDDKNTEALNNLAWLYAEDGERLLEAESLIKRALEEKPNSAEYLDTLGFVYMKQGRNDDAQDAYQGL